jgi:phosphoglycerate kinase
VLIPVDVGLNIEGKRVEARSDKVEKGSIFDIGEKTMETYAERLLKARKILVNGPMGVYEQKGFEIGTKRVLEAIAKSDAYSLVGGGHTITAIEELGVPQDKFSYISLSGKALIEYLSGKELPGIRALKENLKVHGALKVA